MTTRQHSSFAIVFILGLLAMLMPLSIDMYLPALPVISAQFGVPAGSTQMTLSTLYSGLCVGAVNLRADGRQLLGVSRWCSAVRWCLPPPRWRVRWQTPSIS